MKSIMITCVVLLLATSALTAPAPTQGEKCVDKLFADIYILMDGSNSVPDIGWGRALTFVVSFIKSFTFGRFNVQFAIGTFSNGFVHVCDLNTYTNPDELSKAVLNITHLKGDTYTDVALRSIRQEGYLTSPLKGARVGASKNIMVITDGEANRKKEAIAEADALRELGVRIFAVGVGSVNREELRKYAGVEDNVFSVKSFNGLEVIKSQITQRVCQAPVCTERYQADIYSFIDNSGSINSIGHGRELSFQISLVGSVPIGPNDVQYGFAQFSNNIDPRVEFDTSYDVDVITQIVNSSKKTSGGTYTAKALNKAIDDGHLTGHGRRLDKPLIVIINTDGRSHNTAETVAAADRLRYECNATILVLTVGSVNAPEIIGIAGDQKNVFGVKSLAALESIKARLLFRVCEVASKPNTTAAPTTTTTTTTATPTTTTAEPITTTAEPVTTTPEPITTPAVCITQTPEPETTTPEPETTTPVPETTTPEPETTTPEPETTTPEPETTTPEPETTTPEPDTTTTEEVIPVTPCPADKDMDIIFVIDGSSSIGKSLFDYNRILCRNIAIGFITAGAKVRIGLIVYGTHAYKRCGLTGDLQQILTAITNMPYRNSTTQTDAGLQLALSIFRSEGSPNSSQVICLVTDGASTNKTATLEEAVIAKSLGITILPVGVGKGVDEGELNGISSIGTYIQPDNYNELPRYASILAKSVCDAAEPQLGVRVGVRVA